MLTSCMCVSFLVFVSDKCFFGPRQARIINSIDLSLDASYLF